MEKPDQIDRYEMSDIFISYCHEDEAKAKWLVEALKYQSLSVWWDSHIHYGKAFAQVIEEELDAAKCVVVLWSNNSVKSEWVQTEASEGRQRGILIPVLIEDVIIPLEFRRIQAADLIDWDGKSPHAGVDKLVKAVMDFLDSHETIRRMRRGGYYGQKEARLKEQREEGGNKRVKVEGPQWRWVYQNIPSLILAAATVSVSVVIFLEVSKIIAVMVTESKTELLAAILVVLAVIGAIGYLLIESAPEGGWTVGKLSDVIKDKFQRGKGL